MKIRVPKKLKLNIGSVDSIRLEFDNQETSSNLNIHIPLLQIERMDFVNFHDHHWQSCSFVQYRVKYKDASEELFDFDNKQSARYFSELDKATVACLRTHKNSIYKDNVEGRKACLATVDRLVSEDLGLSTKSAGNKTLIYYTVYFNKGYIELFDLSARSLLENTSKDFDILVITDFETKKLLDNTEAAKLKELKYFITETPEDGVEASKKKVDIFQYPKILEYNKVLFLDCDIVAQKNSDKLLELELENNTLYTVKNKNLGVYHFKTVHHGFTCLSDEFTQEMQLAEQYPFNAGQFMFAPSEAILKHFENTRWFMDNWPSEYFFEQCFMCYYFCRGYLTNINLLRPYIGLNSTMDAKIVDDDIGDKALVHFIAPPLDATKKREYIQDYLAQRKVKETSMLGRLKGFFKRK